MYSFSIHYPAVPTCRVYALDYGLEQDASLDILVPADEKFNSVPSLAYHVTFQVHTFLPLLQSPIVSVS